MEVKPFEAGEEQEWQDFVLGHSTGNYCMDVAWKAIIADTYGKEPAYWICREGHARRITGVAAAFWMDNRILGHRLVALPYLDYGGILAETPAAEHELLEALRWSASMRRVRLELRQERPLAGVAVPPNSKVKMELDLRGRTVENYWSSLDPKARDQIRKAETSGVTVRAGKEEFLDAFYHVFCANMRDLGSPAHSQSLFRNTLRHLPGAEIVLAECGGECIGALFRIRWGGTMAIPWASTLRAYRAHYPNDAIYWDTLAAAFRQGCARVDFGRDTRGADTYDFKRQWLAEEAPLPWYVFTPMEEIPAAAETEPGGFLEMAAALWRHMPARYANRLGPPIRAALSS